MHQEDPQVKVPSNPQIPIWRYMDLPRLVSLLSSRALWFGRADKQTDPLEGGRGAEILPYWKRVLKSHHMGNYTQNWIERQQDVARVRQEHIFMNCWHMAEHESVAMWTLYSARGQGVAVKSTYERLSQALTCEQSVVIGEVSYANPGQLRSEWKKIRSLPLFFVKRVSYAHERELRAVYRDAEHWRKNDDSLDGHLLEVDILKLTEAVYVSPSQPGWFFKAVTDVVSQFGYTDIPVRTSRLDEDELY